MSKIYVLIIALHLITSSDFVFASDPSAYEAAMLRIHNEVQENRQNRWRHGLYLEDETYEKIKLDEAEVVTKALLGPDALSELRLIRSWVEIAPFRDKIVLMENQGSWYISNYRLASNPGLKVGCIYNKEWGYGFYGLKNATHLSSGITLGGSRFTIDDCVTKMRVPTHIELTQIREDVSRRGVLISYKNSRDTLAIVDKQIKDCQEATWKRREAWFAALYKANKIAHGAKTSAGASAVAISEDLK